MQENAWSLFWPADDESILRTSVPPLLHLCGKRVYQDLSPTLKCVSPKSDRSGTLNRELCIKIVMDGKRVSRDLC